MAGMDRNTGKLIDDVSHTLQCVTEIVRIRLGDLVGNPRVGTKIRKYLDDPLGPDLKLKITAELMTAIEQWETRFIVDRISTEILNNKSVWRILGRYRPTNEEISVTV